MFQLFKNYIFEFIRLLYIAYYSVNVYFYDLSLFLNVIRLK